MDPMVEVVALFLGFLGWVLVALPNRYWKTSTVDGNVISTSTIYENLWMSCATDSTGVQNCREFPSLLALNGERCPASAAPNLLESRSLARLLRPGYVQAFRALMIASVVMGAFGLVASLVGMHCMAVSWYAFNITQDFFDPFYPGTR